MPLQVLPKVRRLLIAEARESSFTPHSRRILARLGYRIVTSEELDALSRATGPGLSSTADGASPELLLVDEQRFEAVAELEMANELPIVLLTGRRGIRFDDERIVAALNRPAGLHDLYRVFQQCFEESPRSTPRVSTNLKVRCLHQGRAWGAAVLSLSENGCLMRSPERVPLGSRISLTLQLPRIGSVEVEAESAYQIVPDLGLVFSSIPAHIREAIGSYVVDALAPA